MSEGLLLPLLGEGSFFPEFELLDQDGKYNSLGDLIDQGLVLAFLPKLTVARCIEQILELEHEQSWLKKFEVTVVGICSETPEKLCKFSEEYFISLPLLYDEHSALARRVGVLETKIFLGKECLTIFPMLFFVDRKKRICASTQFDSLPSKEWFQKNIQLSHHRWQGCLVS